MYRNHSLNMKMRTMCCYIYGMKPWKIKKKCGGFPEVYTKDSIQSNNLIFLKINKHCKRLYERKTNHKQKGVLLIEFATETEVFVLKE